MKRVHRVFSVYGGRRGQIGLRGVGLYSGLCCHLIPCTHLSHRLTMDPEACEHCLGNGTSLLAPWSRDLSLSWRDL